jgi:transcriptional regulator with XRE-family HTH domain
MSLAELTADDVKAFRKSVGLSQVAFAAALGTSRRNVEAWEAGINKPPTHLRWSFAAINANLEPWERIELVTVWFFETHDIRTGENIRSRHMATAEAIKAAGGVPVGNSVEVPAAALDGNGFAQIVG